MATLRWLVIGSALLAVPLLAESPPGTRRTMTEIRCDLLGVPPLAGLDTTGVVGRAQAEQAGRKVVGLAALYSLLLPGLGELYADDFSSGKYFLIAEGVLWITYAAFDIYGNAIRDDGRLYATAHAGVIPEGKSDQFYVDVGNFLSVADYNEKKLRDREPEKLYDPALGYAWQWESDAARQVFREQRVQSEQMLNNRKFVGAAILVNHVASAINAARAAIAKNSALDKALGDLRVSTSVMGMPGAIHGVQVTFTRGF